jgi:hypothetical protein
MEAETVLPREKIEEVPKSLESRRKEKIESLSPPRVSTSKFASSKTLSVVLLVDTVAVRPTFVEVEGTDATELCALDG